MRISCVKCSTLYELDDRLIPPSGAPVQCTRCGEVFTARLTAESSPHPLTTPAEPKSSGAQRGITQMFGAPGRTVKPPSAPASPSGPASAARAGTQLFGALRSDSPSAGPPARSERPPAGSDESLGRSPSAQPAPVRRGTQFFGAVAPAAPAAQPASSFSTQRFGPISLESDDSPRSDTLHFSGTPAPPKRSPVAADDGRSLTPIFGTEAASTLSFEPSTGVTLPPFEEPADGRGRAQRRRPSLELPAAQPLFQPGPGQHSGVEMDVLARQRNRVAVAAVLALAIALPGVLAIRTAVKRRPMLPAEVVSAEENALSLLRRDDRRSRKQAIAEIESLALKYPGLVTPTAIQLIALALDLDDVKLAVTRIQAQADDVKRTMARLQDQKSTGDWETQLTAARAQLAALQKESDPLLQEASALDRQVSASYSTLLTLGRDARGREEAAAIRAQAIYYAVKGSDKAVPLLEHYRQIGANDRWDAIALAEYAANAPVTPSVAAEARALSERTRSSDSAFLRAYVLAARLAFAQRDYDTAATLLDAVVALNPSHEVARQLIAWVDEARRSQPPKAPAPRETSGK